LATGQTLSKRTLSTATEKITEWNKSGKIFLSAAEEKEQRETVNISKSRGGDAINLSPVGGYQGAEINKIEVEGKSLVSKEGFDETVRNCPQQRADKNVETKFAPETEVMSGTLETEFFQSLLGLREDFFITWDLKEKDFDFKTAIIQALRYSLENIDFKEIQEINKILESVGFDCNMALMLSKTFGPEFQNPSILWQKVQSFIQMRLDAVVASNPEWSKNAQTFNVFNSIENQEKQYQSILIPSQNGLNGNEESLMMLTETALGDPSTTETWYHATTVTEAEEILKHGFDFKDCMPNRNFSHRDGIYFTDSITSAKYLFQHNAFVDFVVYPDIVDKKKRTAAELNQLKVVVLAFSYHKEKNNVLEKYKKHSIGLRDQAHEERLKKIVRFFSKHRLTTRSPTIEEHGLHKDYANNTEYIIGPHAIISSSKVYVDRELTQLCVRCIGRRTYMKEDFENLIQKEVFVLDVDVNDFCKCLIIILNAYI
jgi:hypothetical protein